MAHCVGRMTVEVQEWRQARRRLELRRGWLDGGAPPSSQASARQQQWRGERQQNGARNGVEQRRRWRVAGPIDSRRDNNGGQGVVTSTKLDDAMDSDGFKWILEWRPPLNAMGLRRYSRVSGAIAWSGPLAIARAGRQESHPEPEFAGHLPRLNDLLVGTPCYLASLID
ncbi:hypothetical protein Scep_012843 [Stephania cephalantha]|uniref:Uncharacterized protein n=1 Tax=Stephania cephalantha TaxID=152367 RepID=A0AAP0P9Y3_9MAGN